MSSPTRAVLMPEWISDVLCCSHASQTQFFFCCCLGLPTAVKAASSSPCIPHFEAKWLKNKFPTWTGASPMPERLSGMRCCSQVSKHVFFLFLLAWVSHSRQSSIQQPQHANFQDQNGEPMNFLTWTGLRVPLVLAASGRALPP